LKQLSAGDILPGQPSPEVNHFAQLNETLATWVLEKKMPLKLALALADSQKNASFGLKEIPDEHLAIEMLAQHFEGTPGQVLLSYLLDSWLSRHWETGPRELAHLAIDVRDLKKTMANSTLTPVMDFAVSQLEAQKDEMENNPNPSLSLREYIPQQLDFIKYRVMNNAKGWQKFYDDGEAHLYGQREITKINNYFREIADLVAKIPALIKLPKNEIKKMLEIIERSIFFNAHRDMGDESVMVFETEIEPVKKKLKNLSGDFSV
jgi:hypothetical protein